MSERNIVCLAGGVGGAKLAAGLARVLPADRLTIIGNTGDDFTHCGLKICPDLDTVMYTLAGRASQSRGWGLTDESWRSMERLQELGGPAWFNLGDLDLATHLTRTHWLAHGRSLTAVTADLCRRMGVAVTLLPMADNPAPTQIVTPEGTLAFQEWFVRDRWEPHVERVLLPDSARATSAVIHALQRADIVIIAPSNPFVSIAPILNTYPIAPILTDEVPVVLGVTPVIGGEAIKGPTAKLMRAWEMPVTAEAVAGTYGDVINGFVCDVRDGAPFASEALVTCSLDTLMQDDAARERLAREVLAFGAQMFEELS